MTHLIGLNSFNLFEDPKFIEVEESAFCYETIFKIDKSIRSSVNDNARASWQSIEKDLRSNGFIFTDKATKPVFWHARQWDEHLAGSASSFFVTFDDNSGPELAGEVFLATNYPSLFALVDPDDVADRGTLLINSNHDIVYPDDYVWKDEVFSGKIPLGAAIIIESQFPQGNGVDIAREQLVNAGYSVSTKVLFNE